MIYGMFEGTQSDNVLVWIYSYMVKEYKHSGEGSTGQSREEQAWGGIYYVLLKIDPKLTWKDVKNLLFWM